MLTSSYHVATPCMLLTYQDSIVFVFFIVETVVYMFIIVIISYCSEN